MSLSKHFSISNRQEFENTKEMEQDGADTMLDQLKSEISGESNESVAADGLNNDASQVDSAGSGEKFQEVLDKYFNEVDESSEQDMEQKLNIDNTSKLQEDNLDYFHSQSSSYYKQSIDVAVVKSKLENRLSETKNYLSDAKNYVSDLRFSDGFGGRSRPVSEQEDQNQHKNHSYNIYEHYKSGYETTMDMPKSKVAQAFAIPLFVSILCGFFIYSSTISKNNNECLSEDKVPEAQRNILESRASILVNPSNDPCEDRFNCYQFKNIDGFYQAVFDGHAGWQVAEFAMKNLHVYIDDELKNRRFKGDKEIVDSITKAFAKCEQEWINTARVAFHGGYPHAARVGACALVAVVKDNKVYVANAGDSKAMLFRKNGDDFERVKLSKTFNANKKYEQERLKSQFKGEQDIVICKRGETGACYVKGRLMPTRALGDLQLKHDEFNFHNYNPELGYRNPIRKENYSGNYINSVPDVQVYDITEKDSFMVLASDGLWDEMNRKEAAKVATKLSKSEEYSLDKNSLNKQLMGDALEHAAKSKGISRQYLSQMRPGNQKRGFVDDITIVVVDLVNQYKK